MMNKGCFFLVFLVLYQCEARTVLDRGVNLKKAKDGTVLITSGVGKDIVIEPGYGGKVIINGRMQVCEADGCLAKLGSRRSPALSCKAILEQDPFAPSGVYYISTAPSVTKVYCYMEYINGCGGGGWTTIMKTDGHKPTFNYVSALWQNKEPYHVTGGQSAEDDQETKLPTYWTMPFSSLCLGMKTEKGGPRWIRLNYKASSLYSVIADGSYRSFSIGRSAWKSLIPDSSLQRNCNREGFNNDVGGQESARIGIISNQQNQCDSPDSRIGFGTEGTGCNGREDNSVFTGNMARGCSPDNGDKSIRTYGYILAQ